MSQMGLLERTRQFLEEPLLGEQDLDTKVRLLLKAEYLRRLGRYRRLDRILIRKYGMTFEEFVARRVVQQKEYTWDVESDAMDWETAVGGMWDEDDGTQDSGIEGTGTCTARLTFGWRHRKRLRGCGLCSRWRRRNARALPSRCACIFAPLYLYKPSWANGRDLYTSR